MADQWEEAAKNFKPDPNAGSVPAASGGNDDWKIWQDNGNTPQSGSASFLDKAQDAIGRTAGTAVSDITGIPGGIYSLATSPVETLKGMFASESGMRPKAPERQPSGVLDRLRFAMAGGQPENTPTMRAPDMGAPELVGHVASAGLLGAGIKAGIKAPGAFRSDPRVATVRALRPTPSNPDFAETLPQTLSTIKAANPGYRPVVENGQLNLIPAAEKAIQAHQEALEPWMQRMEGTRVSGAPIVEATRRATTGMLPSEGGSAQSLIGRAGVDYQDFTPQELRDRLSLLNQRLSSYYHQAPGKQSAALADIPDAVLKAQRDAAADTLYRHLDPENEGAGPRLIQSRTGNLIDLRDAALQRNNAITAEQPLTPFGRMMEPLRPLIRRVPVVNRLALGDNGGSGLSFAEGSQGRSLPLLRKAFNAVGETEGANELGSLPRPGPRLLGTAADTSGAYRSAGDFGSIGSEYQPQIKLLPPASSQIGHSTVTVPDYAGQIKTGANRLNAGPKQLPAASSGIGVSGTTVPDIISGSSRGKGGPMGLIEAPKPGEPPINLTPGPRPDAVGPAGSGTLQQVTNPRQGTGRIIRGGRLIDLLPRRGAE